MCEYDNRREWICTFDVDPLLSMYAGDYLLDVKEEIIRCKHCAHWNTDDDMHRCFVWCVYTPESGYCHRAKKRYE